MKNIFLITLLLISVSLADVISPTGEIKFDVQMDNQQEMILNGTGLGIGVTPTSNLHVNGNTIISKQLFVGGSSGSANLNISGTVSFGFERVTSSTTLSGNSIVLADTSSGNLVLSLPEASNYEGRKYMIKKISRENYLFIRDGGFIDEYSEVTLSVNQMGSLSVISHSGNWHILNMSDNGSLLSSDNLIGWWKLDETSGSTTIDSTGYGNDGTSNVFSGNIGLSGVIQNTYEFNGSDEFIEVPATSGLDIGSHDYTISVWINRARDGIQERILVKRIGGNRWYDLYLLSTNKVSASIAVNYPTISYKSADSTTSVLSSSGWVHLAATMDRDGNGQIYINGVADGAAVDISSNAGDINVTAAKSFIGAFGTDAGSATSNFFDGKIDDLRIYNRLLSAEEISAIYRQR